MKQGRADPVPRGGLAPAVGGHPVRPRPDRRRGVVRRAGRDHRRPGQGSGHRRQPRVLPVHPARPVPDRRRPAPLARTGRAAPRSVEPGGDREAVRTRPRQCPGAERDRLLGLPLVVGLPDRPLPGQGDGAEPDGAALRQPVVRAGLEQQLRRPRADHHGRGHRHRRPGRILRRDRHRPRRDPEPPAAAARADRDGGADLVRGGTAASREAEGAGCGAARPAARPAHRARGVRGRVGRRGEGQGLPGGGPDPAGFPDRDVRGDPGRHRQPPLGRACRSICAPASGWPGG